ncbi:methylthioribulose 1-phosphate dehydratase [Marinobacterium arenosum]|uniref:methylthioribulose 1-phosphate dehydratase n=1 Tax=Marinobacterium arenosum TaxID=2862496 RepID=UPI001C94E6FD|nr:methylthioribulose 1-phosphate dehydratase [Marinobacterium arenosum]MBY4678937.1 methylthioribulose 1-phosphate dehydratase [Marinobacterium arenosum]
MNRTLSQSIIDAGRWIDSQGWCPATGGNFSARIDQQSALVTASGRHKGQLTPQDLLQVDMQGQPIDSPLKPSAETLLHTRLYQLDPQIGAVLHTHSVASTVLSRLAKGEWFTLEGYEMQKSLAGNHSHAAEIRLALFDNTQDMAALADRLSERWQQQPLAWGFLVRGHGLYAWGQDMAQARRHLEGLEFLFACELEMKRLGAN